MKQNLVTPAKTLQRVAVCALLLASLAQTRAVDIVKANNTDNLNLGTSWVSGFPPSSTDVALWNSTVTGANTVLLGTDTNWAGIRIADPAGAVAVSPFVSGLAITAVGGSPTLTYSVAPANPLVDGSRAVINGTVAPTNFTLGTLYYVVNATAATFQLSATPGGTAIIPTGPGFAPVVSGHVLALGGAGIDMSAAINNLTLGSPLALTAGQTWNVGGGVTLTASGPVSGTGPITVAGAGTVLVSGANNYTGGTINNGVLQINSGTGIGATAGGLTNNNGSTARLNTATSVANPVNFNGTVTIDLNDFANNAAFTGNWSGTGTVNVIKQNNAVARTFTMGGSSANWSGFTGTVNAGTNTGFFRFNDGGGNGNTGNSQATMDLGSTTASFLTRNRNAPVSFGVLLGGPGTRVINGSSSSGTSTYSIGGKSVPFTFEGSFVDASTTAALAITKVGTSTTILLGTNKYFGATTVSTGTLQVGNGGTIGNLGSGPIVNNALLVYDRSDAITISNAISGSGNLTLQGGTVATFEGTNASSGLLIVGSGSAADVGVGGSILCPISLSTGAKLIITNNPLFALNQTLSGFGTVDGALTAIGGTISPGGSTVGGTLSFAGNVTETGNVVHQMELATAGPTDLISITGDLIVSGTNSFVASKLGGGTLALGTYPLINYSGNFIGGLTNFSVTVVGVTGTLTNPPNQIALIITPAPRGATNLTWAGDGALNYWDNEISTNWVNGVAQFTFRAGDTVLFDATGAANPIVTVNSAIVQPTAVTVNAASDYTLTGIGSISGSGGLTKNNTGTLIVNTTNNYSGPTIVNGGVLEVAFVANGNSPSAIGASSSNPTNLVFNSSTLRFTDTGSTDRGITLNGTGANVDITSGNLTLNGSPIVGGGTLTKSGAGTLTLSVPNGYTGGTVLSNGVLALGANIANNDGAGGGGLGATNNPVTFRGGTLQLFGYNGGQGNNYATCYNPLIIPSGESGTLQMFPRGPANSGGNSGVHVSLTGAGTMNLVANYVRDDLSGNWSAFTGLINVTAKNGADEMRINNNFGYSNATINLNDGVTLCRSFSADTVNDIGALTGTSLAVVGPGNSSGARSTWRVGWLNSDATFAGTLADDAGASAVKVGSGTWTLSGAVTIGNLIVSNGVVAATSSLTSTNIRVASGAFLDISTLGTLSLGAGQTLGGNGTVLGSADASSGGNVAPGFSIGTLTITNAVTLGGNTIMEVNRSGFVSDKLTAGSINYGGILTIRNTGAALQVGDTFDLFDGVLSGLFTSVQGGYYTWSTANLTVNGTVTVTGTLPPPTLNVSSTPTDIVLSSTGGLPGGSLTIVTATDLSTPLSSWTVVLSDVYDGSGNYTTSIPVDLNTVNRFYAIRAE